MTLRSFAAAAALVLIGTLVGEVPAFAGPREDALDAVNKCAAIADDHARLACYDTAAAQVKSALAIPEPEVAATPEQQRSWFGLPDIFGGNGRAPQTTPQQFGSESLPQPAPPPAPAPAPGQAAQATPPPPPEPQIIDSITATVTDFAYHLDGRFIVFLDNGQIWQQIQGDTDQAHFKKGGPNTVTISRGAFGSYGLTLNDLAQSFKVKRIK